MDSSVKHHKASEYWKKVPATLEGVLGGYPELTKVDLRSSKNFLENLLKKFNITDCYDRALDCGAGIGRVTQGLLVQLYNKVDLVEMCQKFLDEVPKYVNSAEKIGTLYCSSLQTFTPQKALYDVIWIQWVVNYLADADLVSFLIRCKLGLKQNGFIIIKENVSSTQLVTDSKDGGMTRTAEHFKKVFKAAKLVLLVEETQKNFPKELFLVKMFALR
ncbi:N-terminal Xaa-Pro-Lys N-methyltransferase 1-B-like isoform X2 [Zophobas morio]